VKVQPIAKETVVDSPDKAVLLDQMVSETVEEIIELDDAN